MQQHQYAIEGMHCTSCTGKVTAALQRVPGVTRASVTLNPPIAQVELSAHVPTERLRDAVTAAGAYSLAELNGSQRAASGAAPVASAPASGTFGASAPSPSPQSPSTAAIQVPAASRSESLFPLLLIVGYIAGTALLIEAGGGTFNLHRLMQNFMAGFFLVFSFFKFLDLPGFAQTYRTYDVIARKWPAWGMIYPFAELALGVAYLVSFNLMATNLVTLALMLVGSIGVLQALLNRRAIRCACLGTVLNLPMTTVTLVEDLSMAAMAAVMLMLMI